jgi:tetratricopeptide (TPR) repeat protein
MKKIYVGLLLLALFLSGCNSNENSGGINPKANFDAMWDYNDPAASEELFVAILAGLKDSAEISYDQNYHVELLSQIARAQGLQGKFAAADSTLQTAEKLLTEETVSGKMRFLLEKGRLHNSMAESKIAAQYFKQAYQFGQENDLDFYTLDALHMLGIVSEPEQQIKWNLQALQIAENSQDLRVKSWLGPLYNNLGWSYHDQQDYKTALEYFQKGYEYRKSGQDEAATRIAKWSIGRALRSLQRYNEAKEIMLELQNEIEQKELPADGYVYEELAELYLVQNDPRAAKYFKLAYEIQVQDNWIKQNEAEKLARMKRLSE